MHRILTLTVFLTAQLLISTAQNYLCRKRGEEIFRKLPFDIDELIYEVFHNLTFEMATKWEVRNRKKNEDFRLQLFAKQVDLMTRINKDFGERLNKKLQRMLRFEPLPK